MCIRDSIRPNTNKKTINSYTSETHISAQRDFDDFNENFLDMAIDKIINNYLNDYIKEIEESQQEVPAFSCGKCKKYFNDRHSHFINSPKCINHDTLCSICNTFFCGTKGLNIHFIFRHKGKSMNRFTIPIQPVPFDSEVDQAVLDEETNNHGDGIPEETNEYFSLNTHGTHMVMKGIMRMIMKETGMGMTEGMTGMMVMKMVGMTMIIIMKEMKMMKVKMMMTRSILKNVTQTEIV